MSLFDAIHAAVHQRNFGCEAVAARMRSMGFAGMTAGVLQKKVDTNCDTHNLRVDEMLAIMQIVNTDRFAVEMWLILNCWISSLNRNLSAANGPLPARMRCRTEALAKKNLNESSVNMLRRPQPMRK